MPITMRALITVMLLTLLAGYSNDSLFAAEPRSTVDASGQVEFQLPAGWTPLASSTKSRFKPEDADAQSAMLAVLPEPRDAYIDLESYWRNIKDVHEAQDRVLRRETNFTVEGFEVRGGIFDTQRNGQPAVYHDLYLFSKTLQINVHLNGTAEFHERRGQDLEIVARSLRELAAPL